MSKIGAQTSDCFPASGVGVDIVLEANEDDDDYNGRSEWMWFRLPNGDLILGVFPQGDTYLEVEGIVQDDYSRAFPAGA